MRLHSFLIISGLLIVAPALGGKGEVATIKKCQDATGTWHYGDFAAKECERAKITEINKRGIKVKEHKALPTKEEYEAKKNERKRLKEEKRLKAEQAKVDQRLLSAYEDAEAIIRARDERVTALDKLIAINETFQKKYEDEATKLAKDKNPKVQKRLRAVREQVIEYEQVNSQKRQDRARIIEHYNDLLARYRELTGIHKQPTTAAKP